MVWQGANKRAAGGIHHVIASMRRVIDGIFSAACHSTFESYELGGENGKIEQLNTRRVDRRKQLFVDVALGTFAWYVFYSVLSKDLDRPFSAVPITNYLRP